MIFAGHSGAYSAVVSWCWLAERRCRNTLHWHG